MLKNIAFVVLLFSLSSASANAQSTSATGQSVDLPPVVVEGSKTKKQAAKPAKTQAKAPTKSTAKAVPPPAPIPAEPAAPQGGSAYQAATGPVDGFSATSSATGSKSATPIIETPQSISVVGRDEMDARGVTTVQEALSYTPGVQSFASTRSRFLDEMFLRGFDTANGNLGQLRDGLKLQANVYDGGQEPYGLERVDVLKGASSVLYGQLNPGGAINSISKRPSFVPKGEVNVTGGSFDNRQISADVSGPINDAWAYRITALGRESDTWQDHINDDRRYVAPALTFKPSEATTLTVLGYYQEIRTKLSAPLNFIGTGIAAPGVGKLPRDFFIGEPDFDRFNNDSGAVGYLLDHKFNPNVTLRSNSRYYESKGDWDYLTFRGFNLAGPNGPSILRGVSSREEHSTSFVTDNSLEFKFAHGPVKHTVVVGVDYGHSVYDSRRRVNNTGGGQLDISDPVYGAVVPVVPAALGAFSAKRTLDQTGIYFQDQVKLFDKLVLLAGGRHDWADTDTLDYLSGVVVPMQNSAFTGRLGAVYLAPGGFAPFVSYSESFSPTIAYNFGFAGEKAEPTTGQQYEAGIRWGAPDKRTLVSAAVFTIDQQNVVTPTADNEFRQTGVVRSKGFEAEAKSSMGALSATAAYAYTDARVIEDELPGFIGQRRPVVPLNQFSIWLNYDFGSLGLRGLTLGGGVRYVGSTNLVDFATGGPFAYDVPSYTIVDAAAALDLGQVNHNWEGYHLQLAAKNLLDAETLSCSAPVRGCDYGQPATYTGTVSYRW